MDAPSYQELLLENQQLRERIVQLEKRIEELERISKRQAAPFSKGEPKKRPKRPGRKKGELHGEHAHRDPPAPEHVDETVDAPLPEQCPDCGGPVVEDGLDPQFQTDIPRQPIIRKLDIHCGHCCRCGKRLRGRHPLQTSTATGAARSQLGGDAQAAIVYLNKRAGMSYGKIADTFQTLFGIRVSRGACAQVVVRGGKICQPAYERIKERLIRSEHIDPDETGWRIGGHPAWLHGWVGDDGATLYAIDPQRSADVLEKVIGIDWSGSMTHDGFASYERFEDAAHQQCLDHALRRARGLVDKQVGAAKIFPQQVLRLLTASLRRRDQLNAQNADDERRRRAYERFTQRLWDLTDRPRRQVENARFAKHLKRHSAAWFFFLLDPTVPATNHRAEQALRTPIVNRKVWGGNRTRAGGQAQAVLASVLQTCKNKALDAVAFLRNAFHGTPSPLFA